MTKKLTNLLLFIALILTLSACSNDSKPTDAQAETQTKTTQNNKDLQAQIKELKIENSKLKTENAKLLKKMQHQQKQKQPQTTTTNDNNDD